MSYLISLGNRLQRRENSSKLRLKKYGKLYMNFIGGLTSAPISITASLDGLLQSIDAVVYLAVGRGGCNYSHFFNQMRLIRNIFIIPK